MNLELLIEQFEIITNTEEGIKEIRELILKEALRGQLTKRKPTDSSVEDFLKEIEVEKQRLYDEGKIRKPKKVDDIPNSDVLFEIPENWKWTKLVRTCYFELGKTPRTKNPLYWDDDGIEWASISDMPERGIISNTDRKISKIAAEEVFKRDPVPAGTLIMSFKLSIGKVAITEFPLYHNEAIISFKFLPKSLKSFYYWFLPLLSVMGKTKSAIKGNTLNSSTLRNLHIPLPPPEEQQRIVKKIETLFSQVDELEQKVQHDQEVDERLQVAVLDDLQRAETLEASRQSWQRLTDQFEQIYRKPEHIDQLKQAILNEAVRGRLVSQDTSDEPAEKLLERIEEEKQRLYEEGEIRKPKDLPNITDDEIRYELPKGWTWCKFDKVCTIETNLVDPKNHLDKPHIAPNYIEKGSGRLLEYNTIKEDGVKSKKHLFGENRIIYSKIRPRLSKLIISDFVGLCSADMYPIRTFVYLEYIFYYMLSPVFYSQAISSDTRVAMPKINQSELYAINVPLPPLNEQRRIVNKIQELYGWCDDLKEKLSRSQQTDQRLLEALVNGHVAKKQEN